MEAFWSKDAKSYLEDVKKEAAFYERVVKRIQNEGWIERTDEVLDIGSGPGTFALLMASHVRSVTALDEAPGMLDVLQE